MNDGDVVHEWVDEKGSRFRVESFSQWHLRVIHWAGKRNPSWRTVEWFNRKTAEQLLVAFDKMEGKV